MIYNNEPAPWESRSLREGDPVRTQSRIMFDKRYYELPMPVKIRRAVKT
jgi:hypothetical protein